MKAQTTKCIKVSNKATEERGVLSSNLGGYHVHASKAEEENNHVMMGRRYNVPDLLYTCPANIAGMYTAACN